jgi:hypothetical protein
MIGENALISFSPVAEDNEWITTGVHFVTVFGILSAHHLQFPALRRKLKEFDSTTNKFINSTADIV